MIAWVICGWIVVSMFVGYIASEKGRSSLSWFILSLLVSPALSLIVIACVPAARAPDTPPATSADERPCPYCAEPIRTAAIVCRWCGRDIPAAAESALEAPETEAVAPAEPPGPLGNRVATIVALVAIAIVALWIAAITYHPHR